MRRRIIHFRTLYYNIHVCIVILCLSIILRVRENMNDDRYRTHNDNAL